MTATIIAQHLRAAVRIGRGRRAVEAVLAQCWAANQLTMVSRELPAAVPDEPFDEVASFDALRRAETIGRLVGSADRIATVEHQLHRPIVRRKPGLRPKGEADTESGDLVSKLSP